MTIDPTMKCPTCGGSGRSIAIVCGPKHHCAPMPVPCHSCNGTGTVSEQRQQWWEKGRMLRLARLGLDKSHRELAAVLGVKPTDISRAEAGLVDPTALLGRVDAMREPEAW